MERYETQTDRKHTKPLKRIAAQISRPARGRKDRPLIPISDRWRIATDDRLQWIIQRRVGDRWLGDKYLETRAGLMVWLRRMGLLTEAVEEEVLTLPERFPRARSRRLVP